MTAFLKIDTCIACQRRLPWEWIPAVLLNGNPMAGTAVWRSQLMNSRCPECHAAVEAQRQKEQRRARQRRELVQLFGGERPYREFTFEAYEVSTGNQSAYERCKRFNPSADNLYLWGSCGVGKTHLAYATARKCFEESLSVEIVWAYRLSRQVRSHGFDREQAGISELIDADVLILDELGTGTDTPYGRQLLQEILDARRFRDRHGLVITSRYSLDELAAWFRDDAIPSRLAGCCCPIKITGVDHRVRKMQSP